MSTFGLLVLTFGAFLFWARYIGTICNLIYSTFNCIAFLLVLTFRFYPVGNWCSYNDAPNSFSSRLAKGLPDEDGTTYRSDATYMAVFGILQGILWVFQCFCCCLPCIMTPNYDR